MATATTPLDELAKRLNASTTELGSLPHDLLGQVMDGMGLTPQDKAAVFLSITRAAGTRSSAPRESRDVTTALLEFFTAQERRTQQRWRARFERHLAERSAIESETLAHQRAMYVDMAKSSLLSPDDVIAGTYLLFGDDAARRFYIGTVLRHRGLQRVIEHNLFVASKMPESFLHIHGETLLTFPWPLFPCDAPFSALNEKLLHEGTPQGPTGAGAPATRPSVFRATDLTGGAYYVPVQTDSNSGASYVDLSEIEAAYLTMQQTIHATQQGSTRGRGVGSRGRGGATNGRGGQPAQQGSTRGRGGSSRGRGWATNGAYGAGPQGYGGEPQGPPPPAFPAFPAPHLPALPPYPTGVKN